MADFVGTAIGDEKAEGFEGALGMMEVEFMDGHGNIVKRVIGFSMRCFDGNRGTFIRAFPVKVSLADRNSFISRDQI